MKSISELFVVMILVVSIPILPYIGLILSYFMIPALLLSPALPWFMATRKSLENIEE